MGAKMSNNKPIDTGYTPDVLSCLADLSNDEVFTPPEIAKAMIDLLPEELFANPNTTFLDPACKSGIFLREIAKKLLIGLEDKIPDLSERIDHILHKQLFGIAITELTSLMSRRSLYCSKFPNGKYSVSMFDNIQGNIKYRNCEHTFVDGKCMFCGCNDTSFGSKERKGLESHAYEFVHTTKPEEIFNMKFDVIIGNPPYQLDDNGNAASASPIYQLFVEQAIKLNPHYLCMIIPARWYAGGKGLDSFRERILSDSNIKVLCDIPNTADCFPGVNIAGGICYFLRDRTYKGMCEVRNLKDGNMVSSKTRLLSQFPYFVRNNTALSIIEKVRNQKEITIQKTATSRNYFGIQTTVKNINEKIGVTSVLSSKGWIHVKSSLITDKDKIINKYKVVITYAMSGGNKPSSDGKYQIVSSLTILKPGEACSETFLIMDCFNSKTEAENMCSYVATKFFRFLLLQTLSSIHITKDKFMFVPKVDYSHSWSDKQLIQKYSLTQDETTYIDTLIKPMTFEVKHD